MTKECYSLYALVKNTYCNNCDAKEFCNRSCATNAVLDAIKRTDSAIAQLSGEQEQEGCQYCTNKKGKNNTLYWDDNRGGYREALFCPNCGKKLT